MNDYSFRHLDESTITVYQSTVRYGFYSGDGSNVCLLLNVKGGYVVETPTDPDFKWIRGQHLETLKSYFKVMKPLRIISHAY